MKTALLVRIFFCIFIFGLSLYCYIDKQNSLTELRLGIPALAKELRAIQENNIKLQYEIDRFESPANLMELARKPEFSDLKHPLIKDILMLSQGVALEEEMTPSKHEGSPWW